MPDARFAAYVALAALLIVTPGPDMALVTRTALQSGRQAARLCAFGIGAGSVVWGAASILGIGLLLESSGLAFTVLKLLGAAYLVFLGVTTLLRKGETRAELAPAAGAPGRSRAGTAFAQGLLNNLLNPKAGVIFFTVFPQFLRPGDGPLRLVLMMLAYEVILLAWLNLYGALLSRIGRSRLRRRFTQALQKVTGAVLIGLGVRLVLEPR